MQEKQKTDWGTTKIQQNACIKNILPWCKNEFTNIYQVGHLEAFIFQTV